MYTYNGCNDAWPLTIRLVERSGELEDSRNGPVLAYPHPVTFAYTRPQRRVLFCEKRRINPYLHFFEPLWILAGRRDVEFLANIVSRFRSYSDDGKVFNAAYGYRLRHPDDQIQQAIERLQSNPNDRQVVLQIRKPYDMWYTGKDTACNLCAALSIRDGKLNIHVFNRSNDVVWGGPAGGANFPQFTMLQEYLAGHIGCDIGTYYHTTNNLHAYVDSLDWQRISGGEVPFTDDDPYTAYGIQPYPLFNGLSDPSLFDDDLFNFFSNEAVTLHTPFFREVVAPMWESLRLFKSGKEKCYVPCAARDWDIYLKNWLSAKNRA